MNIDNNYKRTKLKLFVYNETEYPQINPVCTETPLVWGMPQMVQMDGKKFE